MIYSNRYIFTIVFDILKKCSNIADERVFLTEFSSVQSLSHVRLFATPWIAARQACLSITNSWSSLRLAFIESVMPSSQLILGHPLLLLPPIPASIRVFSNESNLCMRWPKYLSFSLSIIPSKESQGWSPSEWTGWISSQSKGLSRVFSNTTVQKDQFFGAQLSSQSNFSQVSSNTRIEANRIPERTKAAHGPKGCLCFPGSGQSLTQSE